MLLPDDTEALQLLAACFANPHDMTRYGVLGDWLEERGRPESHIVREAAAGVGTSRYQGLTNFFYSPLKGRFGPKNKPFSRRTRKAAEIDMAYHVLKAMGCRTCRRCTGDRNSLADPVLEGTYDRKTWHFIRRIEISRFGHFGDSLEGYSQLRHRYTEEMACPSCHGLGIKSCYNDAPERRKRAKEGGD